MGAIIALAVLALLLLVPLAVLLIARTQRAMQSRPGTIMVRSGPVGSKGQIETMLQMLRDQGDHLTLLQTQMEELTQRVERLERDREG
jgi:predicted glycosyltransferase